MYPIDTTSIFNTFQVDEELYNLICQQKEWSTDEELFLDHLNLYSSQVESVWNQNYQAEFSNETFNEYSPFQVDDVSSQNSEESIEYSDNGSLDTQISYQNDFEQQQQQQQYNEIIYSENQLDNESYSQESIYSTPELVIDLSLEFNIDINLDLVGFIQTNSPTGSPKQSRETFNPYKKSIRITFEDLKSNQSDVAKKYGISTTVLSRGYRRFVRMIQEGTHVLSTNQRILEFYQRSGSERNILWPYRSIRHQTKSNLETLELICSLGLDIYF
ncbi:hypothetical protein PPL_03348 [Heterostelium album PN500]|uniref:Uncharacterized protein n=1 Tax=Heterostelium pallidum (strain ATCC 26659 / Pp 5 / PN500) TaxID=670386 RepID=D3B4M3_HETP5|nr:hypothetical protein PPL_03348 [Heterostelium album PN500]EFA84271.1 hypothetical protein PPL_03348 [Heterostelium album PN500]|eukprot:XP_020436387.1 hypothetical protein PPL_03348 [Heterostelium album PN500]